MKEGEGCVRERQRERKSTHCASYNPTQRIPGATVKPVEKVVVSIHSHVVGGAIVEPGQSE